MNRRIRPIDSNYGSAPGKDDLPLSYEDSTVLRLMNDYMKGRLDLEDAQKDPDLPGIENIVSDIVSNYKNKGSHSKDDEKFIRDNFEGGIREKEMLEEIKSIQLEIRNNKINDITSEWVKEWDEKTGKNEGEDRKNQVRNYIKSSLESQESIPEIRVTGRREKAWRKYLFYYITISAAAIISVFILIRTLLPTPNSEKIFNSYYEPFSAVSSVTRGTDTGESASFASAIESYKHGDYEKAANYFSNVLIKDKSATTPRFFMGITQMALGNYNQAINLLSDITSGSGEYKTDAEWYLGLAYLKTGDKAKASICFGHLSEKPGFYRERAGEILRHLK